MSTLTIRFYDNHYQYRVVTVEEPAKESELFTGILEEFNHAYNFEPSNRALWADVIDQTGRATVRLSREDVALAKVWRFGTDEKFMFMPLEKYSLIFLIEL